MQTTSRLQYGAFDMHSDKKLSRVSKVMDVGMQIKSAPFSFSSCEDVRVRCVRLYMRENRYSLSNYLIEMTKMSLTVCL
jgi:hypothetical protein